MCEACEQSLVRRAILRGQGHIAVGAEGETRSPPSSWCLSLGVQSPGKTYDRVIPSCLVLRMVPLGEPRNLFHLDASPIWAQTCYRVSARAFSTIVCGILVSSLLDARANESVDRPCVTRRRRRSTTGSRGHRNRWPRISPSKCSEVRHIQSPTEESNDTPPSPSNMSAFRIRKPKDSLHNEYAS